MSSQYTEEEDKLITWFKDNYKNIILGLIFGSTLVFGFKYYNDMNSNKQYEMSLQYEEAIKDYQNDNHEKIVSLSKEYQDSYPSNIYTAMISLYAAKIYHDREMYEDALRTLEFIINNSNSKEIHMIANARYARILILQKKYNFAETYITSILDYKNNILFIELLGDISYLKSDITKAREYYKACLKFETTPNNRKIIENKLNSIQ